MMSSPSLSSSATTAGAPEGTLAVRVAGDRSAMHPVLGILSGTRGTASRTSRTPSSGRAWTRTRATSPDHPQVVCGLSVAPSSLVGFLDGGCGVRRVPHSPSSAGGDRPLVRRSGSAVPDRRRRHGWRRWRAVARTRAFGPTGRYGGRARATPDVARRTRCGHMDGSFGPDRVTTGIVLNRGSRARARAACRPRARACARRHPPPRLRCRAPRPHCASSPGASRASSVSP